MQYIKHSVFLFVQWTLYSIGGKRWVECFIACQIEEDARQYERRGNRKKHIHINAKRGRKWVPIKKDLDGKRVNLDRDSSSIIALIQTHDHRPYIPHIYFIAIIIAITIISIHLNCNYSNARITYRYTYTQHSSYYIMANNYDPMRIKRRPFSYKRSYLLTR